MKNETTQVAKRTALVSRIDSILELLATPGLTIPTYQRPYKWTSKNINQLFGDIVTHKDRSPYRLGTVVLHRDGDVLNIVDGQQRTVSLALAVKALVKLRMAGLVRNDLREQLEGLAKNMIQPRFESELSHANLRNNYLEISRIVERADFTEELIEFMLNGCEVVVFELADISEAFQFFDSQNARGRDLEPHDLLKAFHLREFDDDEQIKAHTVARWESSESEELASLFAQYLYRIRHWTKGRPARYFGKEDIPLFKGVNLDTAVRFPYADQLRVVHHFVDDYNRQHQGGINRQTMAFPFRLDQTIINGRRFFDMTAHYQDRISAVATHIGDVRKLANTGGLAGFAGRIVQTIDSYEGKGRTGDGFVRTIFDCLLICYIDKFAFAEISPAIEKIFIWAYSLRLKMESVQIASMDNHVLDNNLFRALVDAITPADFINRSLPALDRNRSTKTDAIYAIFKDMRYAV